MKSFALLLCLLLAASSSSLFAQSEEPTEEFVTKFETLRGEVVDSHGNTIQKCSVYAVLSHSVKSSGEAGVKREISEKWEGKDIEGEFSFDVEEPFSIKPRSQLTCIVSAEGYLTEHEGLFRRNDIAEFNGNFGKITLKRAVKVTGRLAMPASAGDESLVEPIINFKQVTKPGVPGVNRRGTFLNDGSFEVELPEDCQMKMTAYSQNAAAISTTIKIEKFDSASGEQDLGQIHLVEGVSVSGVVLTRNGAPVENQLVYLTQRLEGQFVHAQAITDELGEFELAPRLGEVVVRLNEQVGEDGKATNSTGRKLTAKAVNLTLRQGEAAKPIEFREAETFLITGSVALENGRVPENVVVAISDNLGARNEQKTVGKDGTFAFAVPRGSKVSLIIMYNGDNEESFYVSSLRADSLSQNRDSLVKYEDDVQIFNFKPIQENVGPLDFVLLEHIPEHTSATEEVFKWILGD